MQSKEKTKDRPVIIDETMKSSELLQEVVDAMQSLNSLMVSNDIEREDSRCVTILAPLVHMYDVITKSVSPVVEDCKQ